LFHLSHGLYGVVRRAAAILLHLIKLQGGKSIPESGPYAGIGQNERIKRPAFLSGIQD
jgi:hypothetical protein